MIPFLIPGRFMRHAAVLTCSLLLAVAIAAPPALAASGPFADFKGAFSVAYSVKANFNPSVIRTFVKEGIMFDLTALAELTFITKCGANPENVMYTSITETEAEYEAVVRAGVRNVVVASYRGLNNLIEAAAKAGRAASVMIRVNPEVKVHAELHGSMGHGKFGVRLAGPTHGNAFALLKKALSTPGLKFEGFHFHLGSQVEDPSCYAEALEKLDVRESTSAKGVERVLDGPVVVQAIEVMDRYAGLIGERFGDADLPLTERARREAREDECSDRIPFAEDRQREDRARQGAGRESRGRHGGPLRGHGWGVDHLPIEQRASPRRAREFRTKAR